MLTEPNFSLGDYIKTSRVKLLDNMVEICDQFLAVQRYNYSQKLPLYVDEQTFKRVVMLGSRSDIQGAKITPLSSETFAIGLIALELGLMTDLSRKVCNTNSKNFDSYVLEDAFTNFSINFASYPQLINIVHELVGAHTSPRHNPNYIFDYQMLMPNDLIYYDTMPRDMSLNTLSHISHLPVSQVSRDHGTIKEILSRQYPEESRVYSSPDSKKSENSPIADVEHQYRANSPMRTVVIQEAPPVYTRVAQSPVREMTPQRERSRSLLASTPPKFISRNIDASTPQRERSKSPVISKMQASPYRGLLTPKPSRSTSPLPKLDQSSLDQSSYQQSETSAKKKRKYVSRVDVLPALSMVVMK